jgi:hypothetical protein
VRRERGEETMIDLPIVHKIDVRTTKTKCGLDLADVSHTGAYKLVTCPDCRKYKTVQAYYYDRIKAETKATDDKPVEITEQTLIKLRKFFKEKNANLHEFLEN